MNPDLALKVYFFILEEIQGWEKKKCSELSCAEVYYDPLYKSLLKLK